MDFTELRDQFVECKNAQLLIVFRELVKYDFKPIAVWLDYHNPMLGQNDLAVFMLNNRYGYILSFKGSQFAIGSESYFNFSELANFNAKRSREGYASFCSYFSLDTLGFGNPSGVLREFKIVNTTKPFHNTPNQRVDLAQLLRKTKIQNLL